MMKKVRSKTLFAMIAVLAILYVPIIASAEAVPWFYESYETLASIYEVNGEGDTIFEIYDGDSGPPLPAYTNLIYNSESGSYGEASSWISDSSMYARVEADETTPGYSLYADASAEFRGRYTATADFFQFSYSSNAVDPLLYLYVFDETAPTLLHNNYLSGSGVITIPTTQWHDYYVISWLSLDAPNSPAYDISVDYNMAVTSAAPEPISSILFVTGGTLLAGRRFLRRKA